MSLFILVRRHQYYGTSTKGETHLQRGVTVFNYNKIRNIHTPISSPRKVITIQNTLQYLENIIQSPRTETTRYQKHSILQKRKRFSLPLKVLLCTPNGQYQGGRGQTPTLPSYPHMTSFPRKKKPPSFRKKIHSIANTSKIRLRTRILLFASDKNPTNSRVEIREIPNYAFYACFEQTSTIKACGICG